LVSPTFRAVSACHFGSVFVCGVSIGGDGYAEGESGNRRIY
jgi:hypothetical protein